MKKSAIITSLSFAAALLVMGTSTALAEISPDQAKEIALKHAGVNPNEATMLKIEKDFDDGITEYEIETSQQRNAQSTKSKSIYRRAKSG